MRKITTWMAMLLLGALLSWAQQQPSNPPTNSDANSGAVSAQGQPSATTSAVGAGTVQGCLSGSEGNYTLSDQSGTTYQLKGSDSKLKSHVGQEISVTGQAKAPTSPSADTTSQSSTTAGTGSKELFVTSVHKVSSTCTSGQGQTPKQ